MVASVLVLPRALVGARAYAALAQAFSRHGCVAQVADVPPCVTSGQHVLDSFRTAVTEAETDLVVAHSNAGLVAPAVADGIPVVFADAALPPSAGQCAMATAPMLSRLEQLAGPDGLLLAWTRWWSEDDVAPLFPDEAIRPDVEAGVARLVLDLAARANGDAGAVGPV